MAAMERQEPHTLTSSIEQHLCLGYPLGELWEGNGSLGQERGEEDGEQGAGHARRAQGCARPEESNASRGTICSSVRGLSWLIDER